MLKNGTYAFSVASNDKRYVPSDMSPFTVGSSPVNVPITFSTLTFGVTFTESGLPERDQLGHHVERNPAILFDEHDHFDESNGTFAFTAGSSRRLQRQPFRRNCYSERFSRGGGDHVCPWGSRSL